MMQPLSSFVRRLYFFGFLILFAVCLPVAILFASGYRFNSELGFVRTGSIFVVVPYGDAVLSLDGEIVGSSGLLKRSFYIDSLVPGSYVVSVTREGSRPWYRTIFVEPEIVSDARTFLIPEEIEAIPLSFRTTVPTTTRVVSRQEYDAYLAAFAAPAATSSLINTGEILVVEQGDVYVRLVDADVLPESNFCVEPSSCASEIVVEKGKQTAVGAMYFADAVVYVTEEGGIFITEADVRPTAVSAPLYSHRGSDARVVDGKLIVKDGTDLYEIEGL